MKTFATLALMLAFAAPHAQAAASSLSVTENTPAPGAPVTFTVTLNAAEPLNAIEGRLVLPVSLEFVELDKGSSAVSYWLTEPTLDAAAREIVFAGLFLGGKTGRAPLFSFRARVIGEAVPALAFETARAFIHSPDGIEAPLDYPVLGMLSRLVKFPPGMLTGLFLMLAAAVLWWYMRRLQIRWV